MFTLLFYKPLSAILLSIVMVFALVAPACDKGPLSKLDSTLDYAPLFFQGLVISNVITPVQAEQYKRGVDKFEEIADTTKACLSADVKTDALCYLDMGDSARLAIAEYYPAASGGKVGEYVTLLKDVIDLIIRKNSPSVGVGTSPQAVEEELNRKIDALDKLLKSNN